LPGSQCIRTPADALLNRRSTQTLTRQVKAMSTTTTAFSSDADRDVERRVISYLVGRHVPGLRQLSVHAQCGVVTICGRVHSFYEKQLGQQAAQRVAGVVRLVDRIEVAPAISPVAVLGA
jgi:hypothetical protein